VSSPTSCRLGLALKSRDAVAARLFWSRPCEASDLPIPSPSSSAAAAEGQRGVRLTGARSFREIRARCRRGRRRRPRGGAARRSLRDTAARPPRPPPLRARTSAPAASFRARPRPP